MHTDALRIDNGILLKYNFVNVNTISLVVSIIIHTFANVRT